MRVRVLPTLLASTLALAFVADAWAQARVYRWVDRNGVTHYGDRPPTGQEARNASTPVRSVPIRVEPGAVAGLRVQARDGLHEVWADNRLAGPIEVMVAFDGQRNVRASPALPARATVPAGGATLVSRIQVADPSAAADFRLRMATAPGAPGGQLRDVEYRFPLQMSAPQVAQGYGGGFSHNDAENRHAVDFAAPIGTGVVAARDGVVMQVERDFAQAGLDRERFGGRANFIRILHDDGSMALYAHLAEGGVLVRQGQRVRAGQLIGRSGNTGFTSGPHLHFVVQVNRGMRVESVPVRMFGPQGLLRFTQVR